MSAYPNLPPRPEGQNGRGVGAAETAGNGSNSPRPPGFESKPGAGILAGAAPPTDASLLADVETKDVLDLTDEQFQRELFKENNTIPLAVLGLCGLVCLLLAAGKGFLEAGFAGAAGMSFVAILLFVFALSTGSMAAWIVGKLFASDVGSLGGLLLRVGSVVAAYFLVFMGLSSVMDLMFVIVLGMPVLLALAMWLLGMNPIQSFLFALTMNAIVVIALSVVAVSLIAALGPASPVS